MAVDQAYLDELIYRCDIVETVSGYLPLKQSGANHWGLCPFHNEKTPSMSVSRDKQIFKCFGCGEGGNVIHFVMKVENLPFMDAVRQLSEKCGMTMPEDDRDGVDTRRLRKRLAELNKEAARFYHQALMGEGGEVAREYLARRGISPKTTRIFGLGWADESWDGMIKAMVEKGYTKEELERARLVGRGKSGGLYCFFRNRLMFPVIDIRGDVVAFGGRVIAGDGDGRKYINSPDTPLYNKSRTLYGMNLAKKSRRDQFILCEGNIDVIALHQAGFDSAVASCGTSLTADQAGMLGRSGKEVVICYDADAAGQAATQKAISVLKTAQVSVRVLKLPNRRDAQGNRVKSDPDEYIREYGKEAFAALLSRPQTDGQYRLGEIRAKYNLEEEAQRIAFLKEAASFIATLSSAVEQEIFARSAARDAGVGEESMLLEVKRAIAGRVRKDRRKEQREAMTPRKALQPPQRDIRYQNPISAKSEEKLLAILLTQADVLPKVKEKIELSDFSSDYLARIYKKALDRLDAGLDISPAACMVGLTDGEAQRLTDILSGYVRSQAPLREAEDYIEKILLEKAKARTDDQVLLDMVRHKRQKAEES